MSRYEKLGRRIAELQDADRQALGTIERGGESFIQTLRRKRNPRPARLLWAAALFVAPISFLAWLLVFHEARPLVQSPAVTVGVGKRLVVPKAQTIPLHFSDGSHLLLASGTRATVRELSNESASVEVEGGKVQFSVVHRAETRWLVLAGPYRIRVTGTKFELEWSADADRFALDLSEGSVVVSTDNGSHSAIKMVAPEHLLIDRGVWQLSPLQSATQAPASTQTAAPPAARPRVEARPRTSTPVAPNVQPPTARAAANADSWQSLGKQGKFTEAHALAAVLGIEHLSQTAAPAELLALAEICRFSGHTKQSSSVLTALRSRFADREESAVAAFQLGRLFGDGPLAAPWFRTYLRERPQGALAREAAGRLLEVLDHSGDQRGAAVAAESYLARYPSGPHAEFARQVLGH